MRSSEIALPRPYVFLILAFYLYLPYLFLLIQIANRLLDNRQSLGGGVRIDFVSRVVCRMNDRHDARHLFGLFARKNF